MVFLTSVHILDTGFATQAKNTTQLTGTAMANSGTAFQLKGVQFEITSSANLDAASFATNTTQTTVPFISVNPRKFSLTIFLNSNDTDTNNVWGINDVTMLAELLRLPETPGLKAIYYPVTATASGDTRKLTSQVLYQMGAVDGASINQGTINLTLWTGTASASSKTLKDVRYIPCRFESFAITQTPDNRIRVRLEGVWSI